MSIKEKLDVLQNRKEKVFNDNGLRFVFGDDYKDKMRFLNSKTKFQIFFEDDGYFYFSTFTGHMKEFAIQPGYDISSDRFAYYRLVDEAVLQTVKKLNKENEEMIKRIEKENQLFAKVLNHPNYRLKVLNM